MAAVWNAVAASAVLGVLGMDPAGALLAAAAMTAGARRREVVIFSVVVLLGTVVFGTVLTMALGDRLGRFDWTSVLPHRGPRAGIEAAVSLALFVWVGIRLRRGPPPLKDRALRVGSTGAVVSGLLFIGTAATDPTFAATVVLASRARDVVPAVLANTTWILISQLPLVLVLAAVLAGRHRSALATIRQLRLRWATVLRRLVTLVLALFALVLLVDVCTWLVTGDFLVGR